MCGDIVKFAKTVLQPFQLLQKDLATLADFFPGRSVAKNSPPYRNFLAAIRSLWRFSASSSRSFLRFFTILAARLPFWSEYPRFVHR